MVHSMRAAPRGAALLTGLMWACMGPATPLSMPLSPNTQQPTGLLAIQVAAEGRRNKVPLEKGFSQVDWLRTSRSGADSTGVCNTCL